MEIVVRPGIRRPSPWVVVFVAWSLGIQGMVVVGVCARNLVLCVLPCHESEA